MSQAIQGFDSQFPPSTAYAQTVVLGGQLPAGAAQPPQPWSASDTFSQSQAAAELIAQDATSNPTPVQQFEQSQGPPPYTLRNAQPDPNKANAQLLQPQHLNPFQIRQFSDLLKTVRSISAAVLPNFSFSA